MAKAETGVGGSVVSELAYRNDYVSVRGNMKFADEAWRKNRCREGAVSSTPAPPVRPDFKPAPPSRSAQRRSHVAHGQPHSIRRPSQSRVASARDDSFVSAQLRLASAKAYIRQR